MPLIAELLARRVRSDGSAPLVTAYDLDDGTRTELSATTVANWVAKTSNLLSDELFLEPGAAVELLVAERHPGHWMTLVWALACWQTGAVVTLGRPEEARLVVCGPEHGEVETGAGEVDVVACSLHPLGLGLRAPVPAGVIDFAAEVRGQPDVWSGSPVPPEVPAWRDRERVLTQVDLLGDGPAAAQRVLVRPGDPWATVHAAVVVPLRDGGSAVVVSGAGDEDRLAQVATTERVDAVVAC